MGGSKEEAFRIRTYGKIIDAIANGEKVDHWGVRLKKILTEKNIPLREVGRICNTSPSVVSGWVNKGNSPTDLMSKVSSLV